MIQITDLRKSFGPNKVLKGISLNVTLGEVLCIIGPSGSGKSTIFVVLMGWKATTRGRFVSKITLSIVKQKYLLDSHPRLNGFSAF